MRSFFIASCFVSAGTSDSLFVLCSSFTRPPSLPPSLPPSPPCLLAFLLFLSWRIRAEAPCLFIPSFHRPPPPPNEGTLSLSLSLLLSSLFSERETQREREREKSCSVEGPGLGVQAMRRGRGQPQLRVAAGPVQAEPRAWAAKEPGKIALGGLRSSRCPHSTQTPTELLSP